MSLSGEVCDLRLHSDIYTKTSGLPVNNLIYCHSFRVISPDFNMGNGKCRRQCEFRLNVAVMHNEGFLNLIKQTKAWKSNTSL